VPWGSPDAKNATLSTCGRLWISTDGGASFTATPHFSYKVRLQLRLDNRFAVPAPHQPPPSSVLLVNVWMAACSRQVAMAANNGGVVWSHGSRDWDRSYGTRVFKTAITGRGANNATAPTTTKVCGGCVLGRGGAAAARLRPHWSCRLPCCSLGLPVNACRRLTLRLPANP
jgi:hypothetical protein